MMNDPSRDVSMLPARLDLQLQVQTGMPETVSACLAQHTGLSRRVVKDAMLKGCVWLAKSAPAGRNGGGARLRRVRRASTPVRAGDRLELYYDAGVLAREAPQAICLVERRQYSVWYKPPGLLTQGNRYGDHCALLRQVEQVQGGHEVFPVHRLDREAAGLVLVAHLRQAAARLSALFQARRVDKHYRVVVHGKPGEPGTTGRIELALDGKPAQSLYTVCAWDASHDASVLEVRIDSGRKHQIRRHLAALGHPVLGDPRYGQGRHHAAGLQLVAHRLSFVCPYAGSEQVFTLPEDLLLAGLGKL